MNFKSLFNTDQSCIQTTTYIRTLTHIPSFQSLRNKSENPATSFLPRLTHHTHTSIHTQKNKKPQTKPNQNLPPRPSWQQAVIVERLSTQSALQITAKEKKIEFIKTRTQKKKFKLNTEVLDFLLLLLLLLLLVLLVLLLLLLLLLLFLLFALVAASWSVCSSGVESKRRHRQYWARTWSSHRPVDAWKAEKGVVEQSKRKPASREATRHRGEDRERL